MWCASAVFGWAWCSDRGDFMVIQRWLNGISWVLMVIWWLSDDLMRISWWRIWWDVSCFIELAEMVIFLGYDGDIIWENAVFELRYGDWGNHRTKRRILHCDDWLPKEICGIYPSYIYIYMYYWLLLYTWMINNLLSMWITVDDG